MNHVACWLWYYETCEEFDQQICQDPAHPHPHIQVMVPLHLAHHLADWHVSERRLVSLNAHLRQQILPDEARRDNNARREALDLHESINHLAGDDRAAARLRLMPGYDSVAPELEECIHPTEWLLQQPMFFSLDTKA